MVQKFLQENAAKMPMKVLMDNLISATEGQWRPFPLIQPSSISGLLTAIVTRHHEPLEALLHANFVYLNRSINVKISCIVELRSQGRGNHNAILNHAKEVTVTVVLRELEQRLRFA